MTASTDNPTSATAATISQPLDLSATANGGSTLAAGGKSSKVAKPAGKVTTTSLTENNLGTLKKLISVVLDQRYSDKFYKSMLEPSLEDVNKLLYYNDIPVGAILCHIVPTKDAGNDETIEVLALAILAPYRSLGLGSALLSLALKSAATTSVPEVAATKTEPLKAGRKQAKKAILHVQEANEDAKRFYEQKGGFSSVKMVDNYFQDRTPANAWLLEKAL